MMVEELPQEQKLIIPSAQSVDAIKTLPGIHFWETIFWPEFDVGFPFTMNPFCSNKAEKCFGFIHFFLSLVLNEDSDLVMTPKPSLQMTLHPHDHEQCTDALGIMEMQWFIEWCGCLGVRLLKKGWRREKNRKFMTYRQTSTHFWWGKCERKHFLAQIFLQQATVFRRTLWA